MKDPPALAHDATLLATDAAAPGGAAPTITAPTGALLADRYQILGVLGEGGMGTVYRVRDLELDEVVALKVLRRDWTDDPAALERFRQEVKLARRVTHRGIARTFDIGEHGGARFLTMEFVAGRSLARALEDEARWSSAEVVRVVREIAEALRAAHAAGVVHRDLKPDNILLEEGGRVVVSDFGIARLVSTVAATTAVEGVAGTPAYMAPEQLRGEPTDARADLYALGLVLYELLTGRRAFADALARLREPAPDPRALDPNVSPQLAALTLRLLAPEPVTRLSSASELLAALERVAAGAGERPPSAGPGPRSTGAQRLAVFPLRTAGPPSDSWIGDGLTDDLLDSLCMVRGLQVKARAVPLAGETAQAYGLRLGVELVLEGRIQRRGDAVRLTLRLSTTADGFQVWARRFDCPFAELFVISDQAADQVAHAAGQTRRGPTRAPINPEALEQYLRAREIQGRQAMSWRDSFARIQRARALAPSDPTILSAYAYVLALSEFDGGPGAAARLEDGRRAAERALELAPELAEPWVALARVRFQSSDTPGAMRALRRALANGPSLAAAHDLSGRILAESDRLDEAARHLELAQSIDASLGYGAVDLIRLDALRGRWDAVSARLATLSPARPEFALMIAPRLNLWRRALVYELPPSESNATLDATVRFTNAVIREGRVSREAYEFFTWTLNKRTPHSRARRLLQQIEAEVFLVAGDEEHGTRAIEGAVADGLEDLAWLRRCPLLDGLRGAGRLAAPLAAVEARVAAIAAAWDESVTGG
ncbi:MAG: protein kinase [Myxococcales bacterium]|nr:protein kinase [Myxococcales bacterium]